MKEDKVKKTYFVFALIIGAVILHAEDYKIVSCHAPEQYILKAKGDNYSITEPVLWIEVHKGDKCVARTTGQSVGGNKRDFYFENKISIPNDKFPLVVKILVGEKKIFERGARAIAGGGIGGVIGGIAGGVLASVFTGGLGAPAGAAIGVAIGTAFGSGASFLLPVRDGREIASFYIETSTQFVGSHQKLINSDILADGEKIKLVIK